MENFIFCAVLVRVSKIDIYIISVRKNRMSKQVSTNIKKGYKSGITYTQLRMVGK